MIKIKTMTVSNIKAIDSMTADFNGCTALITGANNKGKSSFLKSLFDRIRGTKPKEALRRETTAGFAEAQLTTGEKLRWELNDAGKEKLIYITAEDVKKPLTVELREKFLPPVFDVDRFLAAQPKEQTKTMQRLVGLDFTDIDQRYDEAYLDRENKNRRASEQAIRFKGMTQPPEAQPVDTAALITERDTMRAALNQQYADNVAENNRRRADWQQQDTEARNQHQLLQTAHTEARLKYNRALDASQILKEAGYFPPELQDFLHTMAQAIKPVPEYAPPPQPELIVEMPDRAEFDALQARLDQAVQLNQQAQAYSTWKDQRDLTADYQKQANEAQGKVAEIEDERRKLIQSAKMPEGFTFGEGPGSGILYNDLPFTREQLSSSSIYIAALKLASMELGEVRTLHFDASFLDRQSLLEIQAWAETQDLQLLIERPDFEGGEIEYHLIESGNSDNSENSGS
jgi:hypothetical protein